MTLENLKLWLSLPLVFFQYRRDVKKLHGRAGSSGRWRYGVAAVLAVALSIGFLLFNGGLPESFVFDISVFSEDTPEVVASDDLPESNP